MNAAASIAVGTGAAPPSMWSRFSSSMDTFNTRYAAGSSEIASGLSNLGAALLTSSSLKQQGKAERYASEYNAALTEREGYNRMQLVRRRARSHLSSAYAQMNAKSGVIAEEGGWLEVLASNASAYEVTALNHAITARNSAAVQRWSAKVAYDDYKFRAKQAKIQGILGGVSSIAGGISSIGGPPSGGTTTGTA